ILSSKNQQLYKSTAAMSLQTFYHDPYDVFERSLKRFMDTAEQSLGNPIRNMMPNQISAKMDIFDTDKETIVHVELPGFKKEDISLNISEETSCLTLRGTSKRDESYNEGQLRCSERSYGSFTRTIRLPPGSEYDKVNAKFDDGVLEVKIPKSPTKANRQITIN
ncbi:hypothetical protein L0F63_002153, partial [Massospora cicadina]